MSTADIREAPAAVRPLADRVAELDWYHTFDLPGGVVTPGYFDLRNVPAQLPFPASLVGKRCLDAASADGFFAFEMARRGGDVVSVDLADTALQDWQGPPGVNEFRRQGSGRARRAFEVVREALALDVERVSLSVYDICPELLGTFDYVFMGNVMLHLADPGRAARALRSVTRPAGEFLSFEAVTLFLSLVAPDSPLAQLWEDDEPRWWTPNMAAHRRLVESGGFEVIEQGGPWIFQRLGEFIPRWPKTRPSGWRDLIFWLWVRRVGTASSWTRARVRQLADEISEA
jgi:tRNA (mo5U34)-methyltransferase